MNNHHHEHWWRIKENVIKLTWWLASADKKWVDFQLPSNDILQSTLGYTFPGNGWSGGRWATGELDTLGVTDPRPLPPNRPNTSTLESPLLVVSLFILFLLATGRTPHLPSFSSQNNLLTCFSFYLSVKKNKQKQTGYHYLEGIKKMSSILNPSLSSTLFLIRW